MMKRKAIRQTGADRVFDIVNRVLLLIILVVVAYPLYFVIIASVSDYNAVNSGKVLLYPVGFTLECYAKILSDAKIWLGYRNTILYTLCGTTLNVTLTVLAGYALSRRDLVGRKAIMGFFLFTMFFSGGLIPQYILVNKMGLHNNPVILVLLGAVSVYNLIITRTYFETTLSDEILEAAMIDGCGNGRFFLRIALPLAKAIVAVIIIYYAVSHWNSYFNALIYISDYRYQPLQIVMRDILISSQQLDASMDIESLVERQKYAEMVKYGVVVVSSLPMLAAYPFVQKYFVKGVMIGALKE